VYFILRFEKVQMDVYWPICYSMIYSRFYFLLNARTADLAFAGLNLSTLELSATIGSTEFFLVAVAFFANIAAAVLRLFAFLSNWLSFRACLWFHRRFGRKPRRRLGGKSCWRDCG